MPPDPSSSSRLWRSRAPHLYYPCCGTGCGWYTVVVYNTRTTCEFRYYQESYIHVATRNELTFKGGSYAPLHIGHTGDPTQMRVMWVSGTGKVFFVSGVKTNR